MYVVQQLGRVNNDLLHKEFMDGPLMPFALCKIQDCAPEGQRIIMKFDTC